MPRSITHHYSQASRLFIALAAFLFSSFASVTHAAGIQPASLKYQLNVGGTKVGFINTQIQQDANGGMTSTSKTEITGAFKLLGLAPEITEKVWFQASNGKFKPTKYFEKRTGRKAYESNIIIDWSTNKLNFAGGDSIPIPANAMLQLGTIPLSMIILPSSDFTGQTIEVVKKNGIRKFKIGTPAPAKIETKTGSIHTIKIPAQRLDKPDRKLSVWIAPDYGNLPIKIEDVGKKRTTVMSLVEVNGKGFVADAAVIEEIGVLVSSK